MGTICGADCSRCAMKKSCKGCIKTDGHPFGGTCIVCCIMLSKKEYRRCSDCLRSVCEYGANGAEPQIIVFKKR